MTVRRILIADDEPDICRFIGSVATQLGYEVTSTSEPRKVAGLYRTIRPDVVVLDIVMPEQDGVEVLQELGALGCSARILLMTGFSKDYLHNADKLARIHGFKDVTEMVKPIRLLDLKRFLS